MNNISPGLAELYVGQLFDYLVLKLRPHKYYDKSGGKTSHQ